MVDVREEIIKELFRPARRKYRRRKIIVHGYFETLGADLIEMIPYEHMNRGHRYILVCIDHMSKYAFWAPLRNKSGPEVAKGLDEILKKCPVKVKKILTDKGTDFYNKDVKKILLNHGAKLYSVHTHMKSAICERFIRTIKNKLYPRFTYNGNSNWIDGEMETAVNNYNNTKHRTTKRKPVEINKLNEQEILKKVYNYKNDRVEKIKFYPGDTVRISKFKNMTFEKSYNSNWTAEVFEVDKVILSSPPTYILKDLHGESLDGAFYTEELAKSKYPNIYIVEEELEHKNGKVKVKWLGFPESDNSWIREDKII